MKAFWITFFVTIFAIGCGVEIVDNRENPDGQKGTDQQIAWDDIRPVWVAGCSTGTTCHGGDDPARVTLLTLDQLNQSATTIKSEVILLEKMPKNGWNSTAEEEAILAFINAHL